MEPSIQTTVGMSIFTFLAVGYAMVSARGAILHRIRESWPSHAHFHTVEGALYTQGLCVLVVALTWFPFRDGGDWSWWTIMYLAIAMHGGHLLGDALTRGGLRGGETAQATGPMIYSVTVGALLLYAIGLGLSYQHFY